MTRSKKWGLIFLALVFFGRIVPTEAQALIGDVPPDLTPCLNGGYSSLESDTGFTFRTEDECLIFASLGGIFGQSNGDEEADFFVTNLTTNNIQLNHIEILDSHNAHNVTFGVPSQWQAGVLPTPLVTPNWPPRTTLKLRFTYKTPEFFHGVPGADWALHIVDSDDRKALPDVTLHVADNDDGPGWLSICNASSKAYSCQAKDYVHFALVPNL